MSDEGERRRTRVGRWFRSVTRIFPFDAGHRIVGHESKCANLHGHGYQAYVTVDGPELDGLGRIVDFGVMKEVIGGWIDEHWDHNMILFMNDPLVTLHEAFIQGKFPAFRGVFGDKRPYIMNVNPTAENMGMELLQVCSNILKNNDTPLQITNIRLYETQKCFADVSFRDIQHT